MGDPIKQPNIGDYIDGLGKIPRASVALGKPTNINIDDYKGYLKNGVNSDFDYNLKRAQNQSGWEQAGLFLANVIPNIAGSVIENVGYLGALVTEWGDDRNYSNVLTKLGNDVKNPFGQIFREHPQSTWDLSDPAWWYGNAEGLVESATAFAGVGWGLGKVFSTISELARFGSTAKNIIQGTNALAHLSTAGALAYAEAAQFGGTTYETTYNEQLKKAIDNGVEYSQAKEQAKHIASQGAAAAVQLNTIFATALNLTAIAPLFRTEEGLAMGLKKKFAREASESYGQWETRLRSIAANDPGIAKLLDTRERLLHTLAGEGAQEGVEELINQWAEQRGLDRGKKGKELNGLEDLLGDLEYFFDDTMNSQGALSFVLGAVGGIAQTAGIQAIPYHKVYTDAEGNQSLRKFDTALNDKGGYTTKFVSSRNREKVGNRAFFENTKKAVLNDFKRISDIKTELEKALKNNDTVEAERLKFQLFDSAAINSIQLGLGDSFSSQFDEIANLDNETPLSEALTPQINQLTEAIGQAQTQEEKDSLTIQREKLVKQAEALAGVTEAMQRGFAKDTKDNEYKAQAREAESDSKEYARLWDDIQKKHSSEDEYHSRYADYLFAKTVDVRRKEKILNKFEQILNKEQAASEEFQNSDLAEKSITEARVDNEVRNRLTEDYKAIKEAADKNDEARLEELLKKYLPNVDSSSDLATEAPKIVRSIINKIKAIDKRFNDNVESLSQTEGYLAWKEKNPDKEVIDYLLASQKQSAAIKSLTQDRIELNTSRAQLQTNKEQLENLQTAKGKKDYIAKAKESTNRLAKTIKAKIDKDNKAYIDNLFSDKSAQELDTVQKAEYVKSLQSELESLNQELANLQIEKNTSLDDRSWLLKKGLIGRRLVSDTLQKNAEHITNLNKQIQETQAKITTIEAKLKVLVENPETEIEDLEGTEEPGVTIKPLVKSNDTTVLVSTIDQYVATPLQSASILTDLEDYETALDNGTPFSLNHLADLGYVRNGVLTAGQAAAIMQVFKEQYEDLQTEEKETEDDKEAVDELQEKINIINQKRANDLATLKKGSKGVVAKRKEINDAADAEIREITQPELFAEKKGDLKAVEKSLSKQESADKASNVGGDVMKGVNDKMRQTELEMEFKGNDAELSFKNNDVEIVVAKPIGADGKYSVTVSEKSDSNTGFTLNEGKTKLFDTKLEALEYAKEQKEQSLSTPKSKSVDEGVVDKKADIERRREEELNKETPVKNENVIVNDGTDNLTFKIITFKDGSTLVRHIKTNETTADNKSKKLITYPTLEDFQNLLKYDFDENAKIIKTELVKDDYTDKQSQEVKATKEKTINAKYDAELSALEKQQSGNVVVDEGVVDKASNVGGDVKLLNDADKKTLEGNKYKEVDIGEEDFAELFAENTTTENTSTSTPKLTSDDVASEDEPYSEPNEQLSVLATSLELTVNDGLKTIDAAAKINTLTHTYLEYVVDGVFTKVEGGLNPNVNPLYLKPGYLKGGDSIQLVVDEDWNGTVNDTDNFSSGKPAQKVDKFANYKNPDGTLDMNKVGTIPIKIVDTRSGTILGYLPTTEWIGAKYETGDYRNVVDEKYDSKGELVFSNNVQEQQNLNTALRTKLTVAYNTGKKEGLIGQISSRSEGVVTETTPGLASELLPDPNLKMAILNSGAAYTEKGVAVENLAALSESYKNVPGVLLPAANGNLVFSPLLTKTLEKGQIDTVLRAIEIYLTIDGDTRVSPNVEDAAKKAAKQLFDATGFDITTSEGLEAFINQNYYYTRGFNDAEIKANQKVLKGKPKSPKFLLSISKSAGEGYNKSYIKAGVTFLNKLAKAEIDENGLLNQDFKDLLYDKSIGLSSRFRNVVYSRPELGIKGINSPGAFNEVIFQPKSGSFKVIPHESYNDMIKASSFTQVNGKNQLSSGEYVYMAHPNTQLDYKGLIDQSIQSTKQAQPSLADLSSPVESTTGAEELTEAQKEFIKTLDTDLTNSLQSLHVAVQSAGTVPGTPISLENLQELLTFTPIENRNGKTPLEVMEEVTKLGLASLPKDWNPFYQCK
jgi:hypothetical protein